MGRWENIGVLQNYLYYQNAALANAGNASAPTITNTLTSISADYPAHAPSSYQVKQGDTFQTIAQTVWGDSRMWYLIADANGKDAAQALVAGTSLKIPNVVSSTHNTATTFKPYNPNEVIGDTITPPQAPKPKKKKCNAVASIVMVVVAVVVTIFTAGAGAALAAGTASTLGGAVSAGMSAVMAGGVAAGVGGAGAVGTAGMTAAYAAGAVVGSLASQAVGKAMGVVDHISWRQAAVAGITAGAANWAAPVVGAAASATGSATVGYAAQGVFAYGSNYIGSKIVGLDTSFSWKNMAASAAGAAIAGNLYSNDGFAGSVIRGQVSAHASAWMRDKWLGGDRPDYGQVAADAFGNSLVDYAVGQMRSSADEKQKNAEVREKYRYAMASTDVDSVQGYMSTDTPNWKGAVDPDLKFLAEVKGTGWFGLETELSESGDEFVYAPPSRHSDVPTLGGSSDVYYPQSPKYGFFEGVDNYIYANGVFDRPVYDGGILANTLTAAAGAGKLAVNIAISGLVYSDEFLQGTGLNKVTDPLIAYSGIGLSEGSF